MRKYLCYLFLAFFLFSSCENSTEDVVEQTSPLIINVLNLKGDTLPVTKGASVSNSIDSILNNFGVLNYLVFDATGKFVHQKKQLKGDEAFGQITDELKIGQYTVVLISSTGEIRLPTNITTLTATRMSSAANSGDIFYKKLTVNIPPQGVIESVLLDRIVGCLQVRIEDRITDNIKTIELQVENEMPYFNINSGMVETTAKEQRLVSASVNASNRDSFNLGLLLMNDQIPLIAQVRFLDASNKTITMKQLPPITNVRGQRISAEGTISDFMSLGFSVGYNDTWSDTIVVRF